MDDVLRCRINDPESYPDGPVHGPDERYLETTYHASNRVTCKQPAVTIAPTAIELNGCVLD